MANSDGNQNWLALYREAVLEPDRKKVKTRVAQAQVAIQREPGSCGTPEHQKRVSDARWTRLSISSESSACSEKRNGDARARIVVPTPLRRLSRWHQPAIGAEHDENGHRQPRLKMIWKGAN